MKRNYALPTPEELVCDLGIHRDQASEYVRKHTIRHKRKLRKKKQYENQQL